MGNPIAKIRDGAQSDLYLCPVKRVWKVGKNVAEMPAPDLGVEAAIQHRRPEPKGQGCDDLVRVQGKAPALQAPDGRLNILLRSRFEKGQKSRFLPPFLTETSPESTVYPVSQSYFDGLKGQMESLARRRIPHVKPQRTCFIAAGGDKVGVQAWS
jgi:hypothetical protein